MVKKVLEKKGQALIETIILLPMWVLITQGMITLFIIVSGSLWIQHSLYQSLVCFAEGRKPSYCREKLLKEIKKGMPLGRVTKVDISENSKE